MPTLPPTGSVYAIVLPAKDGRPPFYFTTRDTFAGPLAPVAVAKFKTRESAEEKFAKLLPETRKLVEIVTVAEDWS